MVELKSLTEDAAFLNSLSMPWTGFELGSAVSMCVFMKILLFICNHSYEYFKRNQ